MSAKTWVPLAVSVILGLGAALLAGRVLRAPHPSQPSDAAAVVVAARDIDRGTELTAEDLTTMKYPARAVPPEAVMDAGSLVGRVTLAPILKGQLAGDRLLAPAGTPGGLQSMVPSGMRAVTLEVNEFSGVGGMLVPGERVDVIANIRNEEKKELMARTIVQNVTVLAIGRSLGTAQSPANNGNAASIPNNATLLVTPKEAQAIQLASQGARPWLVLRGYRDQQALNTGTTEMAELRGESDAVPPRLVAATQPAPMVATTVAPAPIPATQPAVQTARADRPAALPTVRVVRFIFGGQEQKQTFPVEVQPDAQLAAPDTNYAVPR